ncbi:eIF2A-related protein, partial [Crocosphaera sp. Alani8]|uniref:eIF2A-related protein n=1 Tax=Crocosphaera sp. Alani8 TaxID=3038952 RepID=UPI003141F23E
KIFLYVWPKFSQRVTPGLLRRYEEAEIWLRQRREELSNREQVFLEMSIKLRHRQEKEEEVRQQRELEQERKARKAAQTRTLIAVSSAAIISVLGIILGVLGFRAEDARQIAEERQKISLSNGLVAQAELMREQQARFLEPSILLAMEAMRFFPYSKADPVLRKGLILLPKPTKLFDKSFSGVGGLRERYNAYLGENFIFADNGNLIVEGGSFYEGGYSERIKFTDIVTGNKIKDIKFKESLDKVILSITGKYLVAKDSELLSKKLYVWNTNTDRKIREIDTNEFIEDVTISSKENYVAVASGNVVRIFKIDSGEEVFDLAYTHEIAALEFTPDEKYIAFSSLEDNKVKIFDLKTKKEFQTINTEFPKNLVFSPDSKYLVSGGGKGLRYGKRIDSFIEIWETSTRKRIAKLPWLKDSDSKGGGINFSRDSKYLAFPYYNTVIILELSSGKEVTKIVHQDWVNDISFSKDGKFLVTASNDNTARLWDINSGDEKLRFIHQGDIYAVTFLKNGEYIATASEDGTARLWKVDLFPKILQTKHKERLTNIQFSPSGDYLATTSSDNTTKIWNFNTGLEISQIPESGNDIVFTKDEKHLITTKIQSRGSANRGIGPRVYFYDRYTHIWDIFNSPKKPIIDYYDSVTDISAIPVSPNGKYLAQILLKKHWPTQMDKSTFRVKQEFENEIIIDIFEIDLLSKKYQKSKSKFRLPSTIELSGKKITTIKHKGYLQNFTFSDNGDYFAAENYSGNYSNKKKHFHVWSVLSGEKVLQVAIEKESTLFAIDSKGKHLVLKSGNQISLLSMENKTMVDYRKSEHESPWLQTWG